MSFRLIIQDQAILEIKDAFEWYEEQKEGLGHEFIDEIEDCYNNLSKYPERYSYINHLYRRIKTNRFPYILIYEIEAALSLLSGCVILNKNPSIYRIKSFLSLKSHKSCKFAA
jgi:hypothetical protein